MANKSYGSTKGTVGKQVLWLKKGHDWQTSHVAQERARLANKSYGSRKGTANTGA